MVTIPPHLGEGAARLRAGVGLLVGLVVRL